MKKISLSKQTLFSALIFVIFIHILEFGYRAYQKIVYEIPIISGTTTTKEQAVAGATTIAVSNPLLHYLLNPDKPSHTKDHFRQTDKVENPKFFIVCMGGSSTYGTGVSAESAYPNQLQRILNAERSDYKVLNAGVPAWSLPHHIARYLFDLRNHSPSIDTLILYFGYNDMWNVTAVDEPGPGHTDRFETLESHKPFYLKYRVLIWMLSRFEILLQKNIADTHLNDMVFSGQSDFSKINNLALDRFRNEFDMFLKLLKMDAVKPLVILQDNNGEISGSQNDLFEMLRNEISLIAKKNSVQQLDMRDVTKSNKKYFADNIHMNKLGNELRARFIADQIRESY